MIGASRHAARIIDPQPSSAGIVRAPPAATEAGFGQSRARLRR